MSHDHPHDHAASVDTTSRAFAWGVMLNLGFVFIEAGFGLYANSLALLAATGEQLLRLEKRLSCADAGLGLALDIPFVQTSAVLGLDGQVALTGLRRTAAIEAWFRQQVEHLAGGGA